VPLGLSDRIRHYDAARTQWLDCRVTRSLVLNPGIQFCPEQNHNRENAGLCVEPPVAEPVKRAYGELIAIGKRVPRYSRLGIVILSRSNWLKLLHVIEANK
jgi:hypothetical protein